LRYAIWLCGFTLPRASVKAALRDYETDIPMILNSTMGEFNGALGAAALAVHQWKPARSIDSHST